MTLDKHLAGPAEVLVKHISPEGLSDLGRDVLDHCFGGHRRWIGQNPGANPVTKRFSGHPLLPGGFYYTVAKDRSGDDGGTLAQELKAYAAHGSEQQGLFEFWDSTVPIQRAACLEFVQGSTSTAPPVEMNGPCIVVALLPFKGQPHPVARRYTSKPVAVHVCIVLSIERLRFSSVVDLREPQTARNFAYDMTRLPFFPNNAPLDSFRDLLPTMLRQNIGGTHGFSNAIGSALRHMGAQALIFPSARSDCFVESEDGIVRRWGGWNLVRYAGAPDPEVIRYVDLDPWLKRIGHFGDTRGERNLEYAGVSLEFEERDRKAGSWRVTGLSAWQDAFFEGAFIGPLAQSMGVRDEIQVVIEFFLPKIESGDAWLQFLLGLKFAALGVDSAKQSVRYWAARCDVLKLNQTADILRHYERCCP
jgi:hypothetical protein